MGSTNNLHQLLRILCLNTDWNSAIFWKLQHRARMMLTWEDAYYDNPIGNDSSENLRCQKTLEQIGSAKFSHDPLGLAIAKMSCHVYSLGEGIVGQVAVTGKYRWIRADNLVADSSIAFEFAGAWQSLFSAGIRTIVVVAVIPLGVVQLGSLNKVTEDMAVVTNIRNLFLSTQDYTLDYTPSQIQSSPKSSPSPVDACTKALSSKLMPAYLLDTENTMKSETPYMLMPFQCSRKNDSPQDIYQKMSVDVAKHEGSEIGKDRSSILLQSISNMMNPECQKFVEMEPVNERKCEGMNISVESERKVSSFPHNMVMDNTSFNDLMHPLEKIGADSAYPSDFLDAVVYASDKLHCVDINQNGVSNVPRYSDANSQNNIEKSKFKSEPCYNDAAHSLKFPVGCELHEALGPGFLKGSNYFDSAAQVKQDDRNVEVLDEISSSQLTSQSHPEHLLEAMVANLCRNSNDINGEVSFSTSMPSAMASGRNTETSIHSMHTINSEGYSIDQSPLVKEEKQRSLSSSAICGMMSPKGFSSPCPSSCSEQFERSSEPAKNSKKRARPGESCRPRPRDRQLIQDRIKELRELVPNGAKCSIDSLLECTIKHMLFLQSVTKHADKLNKVEDASKTKRHHMETDSLGTSSYQQGSSWAMEVGGHLKVRSILVENLNKNGQMLVEMLCEECSHFLEIAEAIRSLGLTILKGATEARGEKTCLCFVVEQGQNNRNLHRLDILWPLVQILQSKSTIHSQ
ncbi:transcription factor EMB1444-like isoform X1 [Arachis stenosperma]|uniref:transcription factor EMB1444-like isoform X1 n=1 Tax=Arachis stenosperma TaxID=217475 RepID=UPI0025AD98C9|nr:transcription factor EMB1444-like isoform X1 [Arachis stenosperma]